jgi:hypothetical protein
MAVQRELFSDPTPNALIQNRIIRGSLDLARHTDLSPEEQQHFIRLLILLGKKLAAVWVHKRRYEDEESALIAKVKENQPQSDTSNTTIDTSEVLFLEFDEFLVQVKSALDYLVKIPVPILGRRAWNLRTFGEKGATVAKALKNNVGKNRETERDQMLEILFAEQHRDWLTLTIQARDKVNHLLDGEYKFELFSVYAEASGGSGQIRVPMWSTNQTISECLAVIWNNLVQFVEDFIALFLRLRALPGLTFYHEAVPIDSVESPWSLGLK